MKVEKKVVNEYVITLSEVEASWLKAVMQNTLWGCKPEEEDSFDREMRTMLFHQLDLI